MLDHTMEQRASTTRSNSKYMYQTDFGRSMSVTTGCKTSVLDPVDLWQSGIKTGGLLYLR